MVMRFDTHPLAYTQTNTEKARDRDNETDKKGQTWTETNKKKQYRGTNGYTYAHTDREESQQTLKP